MSEPRIDAVIGAGPYCIQAYSPVKDYRSVTRFERAEARDEHLVLLMDYGFDIEAVTDNGLAVQIPERKPRSKEERWYGDWYSPF